MLLTLPRTHLIGCQTIDLRPQTEIPATLKEQIREDQPGFEDVRSVGWDSRVAIQQRFWRQIRIRLCIEDYTLFPLIRLGSFVQIDVNQTRVDRAGWHNEYDRPIYFVELRESYACSWCEPREGRLLLIPYPKSRNRVREVRFPGDAGLSGE
jgi:hypothetical protein